MNDIKKERSNKKIKLLDYSIKTIGIIVAIVGILLALFYINTPEPNLEIKIIANTSIVDIKEDFPNLNIVYDSINFINDKKNISITILEIINTGNKSITTNDYDLNIPFGFKFTNADLIKVPELISSSDSDYFKDIIVDDNKNNIVLKYKIIDPNEYFQLKMYSIHDNDEKPKIETLGKISGQKRINIIDHSEIDILNEKKAIETNKINTGLSVVLIIILSHLVLSLFKDIKTRRKTISLLQEKNNELAKMLEKLEKLKNI